MYVSTARPLAIAHRSHRTDATPMSGLMALLGRFEGYFPGYSRTDRRASRLQTWAILKAHTNRRGRWALPRGDPRDRPAIDFQLLRREDDPQAEDLAAVVAAIRLAAP